MEDDSFIITGGAISGNPISRVIAFNENGWLKNLPDLMVNRVKHGCTSFFSDGTRVYNFLHSHVTMIDVNFPPRMYL